MMRSKSESTKEDKVISWGRGKGSKPDRLRQVKNENEWGAGKPAPFSLGDYWIQDTEKKWRRENGRAETGVDTGYNMESGGSEWGRGVSEEDANCPNRQFANASSVW